MDVYSVDRKTGEVLRKYWDGSQWYPLGWDMESLGGDLRAAPAAVSCK